MIRLFAELSGHYHLETVVGAPEWLIHWDKWSIHTLVLPGSGRDAYGLRKI
jgi:hypothetical protein